MPEIWNGPLEKIDDFRWRIPKSYKQGMRVDGVIYADEKLLEDIRHDKAAEQVANVAFLPGIVKASLAMPDIHWGYGFCLASDAKVLTSLGFYKPIADFERDWNRYLFAGVDLNAKKTIQTPVLKFLKLRPKKLFKIITKVGNEIKATEDHPLFTPSGMKPVKDLYLNDRVAIFPFQGVEYKRPPNKVIISERNIHKTLLKLGRQPGTPKFDIVIKKLKQRGLLSLTYDHPKLPYILKVMGFVFGDGAMNFIGKRGDGVLHFAGKPQDLEEARKDLERIGYTPSPVHFHKAKIIRGNSAKYYDGHSFLVNAASLVVLLETLGVPKGSKVAQAYRVPRWIFEAPLWQKRLFLASLFGCELRIPHRRLNRRGYFNAPVFPMAKREGLIGNGIDFLNDISSLLKEFGVRTININKRRRHIDTKGNISWALELLISPKPENIFNLWAKVGFEYNFERLYKANIAVQYLKLKLKILKEKKEAIKITIPNLLKKGLSYQKIAFRLAGNPLTPRFITDVCYRLNRSEEVVPRIPAFFPSFDEYLREVTEGLGHSGMVWDEIIKIEEVPSEDFVYDFTVFHPDHNFIANNFVVSNCIGGVAATDVEAGGVISPGGVGFDINCGVRLMRTSLTELEVKQVLEKLVWGLFNDIPAGVGSKGDIKISEKEEEKLLVEGAGWVVKHGYGTQDDLDHTEERGAMEGADPAAVSERAYERGKRQAGTLGSGNHFLEVQVIDEIYDKEAAEIFDLQLGQITVMIHSGSRGLGYQVCDDYTKDMGACLAKYNINVPDRQLASAPVQSKEGQAYLGAMRCAANYAWANRQCLMHLTRMVFEKIFNKPWHKLGMNLIYDVAHNIAKLEKHNVEQKEKLLCVHRKGATRAFGPAHPELPPRYKKIGQPVIIPGDMGRNSYLLLGTQKAAETFFSTCHGSGRLMSRSGAISKARGRSIAQELAQKGIIVKASGRDSLAEEMPEAYKDVNDVVSVVAGAGISKRVCRMRPVGVIKG